MGRRFRGMDVIVICTQVVGIAPQNGFEHGKDFFSALGSRVGYWVASLFVHATPRFALRPSEQRLLLAALRGGTDEALAAELRVSLSAVKKTWVLIYERVSAYLPDFSSDRKPNGMIERGKEKKQRLLNYLREHPEELRPASL
jgi:hypothetical protein